MSQAFGDVMEEVELEMTEEDVELLRRIRSCRQEVIAS
jgi:hypothetical protein